MIHISPHPQLFVCKKICCQFVDPKYSADLHLQADMSAVRTVSVM